MPLGRRSSASTGLGFTILSSTTPGNAPVVVVWSVLRTFFSSAMVIMGAVCGFDSGDSPEWNGAVSGLAGTSPAEHWFIISLVRFFFMGAVHSNLTLCRVACLGPLTGPESVLLDLLLEG